MRKSVGVRPGLFLRTIVVGWFCLAAPAMADCLWEGQSYPEGTRIGDLVCENGEWVIGHRTTPPTNKMRTPLQH